MEEFKLLPLDLSLLSEDVIEILLSENSTEPSFFEEVARKNTHRPSVLKYLLNHPLTSDTTRKFAAQILNLPVPLSTEIKPAPETEKEGTKRAQRLLLKIQKLKPGEKLQLALRGSREARSILIRDSNKEVVSAVLENPKITETEVELIAKQKKSPVEVLRAIAQKREWMRTYSVIHALVTNPKTPIAISLRHINNLRFKDLSLLEKNRNLPDAVRSVVKKLIETKKSS